MRIVIISDLHANAEALRALQRDYALPVLRPLQVSGRGSNFCTVNSHLKVSSEGWARFPRFRASTAIPQHPFYLRARRKNFPVAVFGNSSRNSTTRGHLYAAIRSRQNAIISAGSVFR